MRYYITLHFLCFTIFHFIQWLLRAWLFSSCLKPSILPGKGCSCFDVPFVIAREIRKIWEIFGWVFWLDPLVGVRWAGSSACKSEGWGRLSEKARGNWSFWLDCKKGLHWMKGKGSRWAGDDSVVMGASSPGFDLVVQGNLVPYIKGNSSCSLKPSQINFKCRFPKRKESAETRRTTPADTDCSSILPGKAAFDRNGADKAGRCRREWAHVWNHRSVGLSAWGSRPSASHSCHWKILVLLPLTPAMIFLLLFYHVLSEFLSTSVLLEAISFKCPGALPLAAFKNCNILYGTNLSPQ